MTRTHAPIAALKAAALLAVACLVLPGCTESKRALGFDKAPPDEFQVVARAPLSLPPDFSLRPPAPGTDRPQESNTRDQARRALAGTPNQFTPISNQGRTPGDMALLKRWGVESNQPDIRLLVNKETQALADADKSFTDKLVFWRKPLGPGDREMVDPAKESQRLRENQALGRSPSTGDTPKIERRRRAWLEDAF